MKNRRRCDSVVRRASWLLCLGQAACLTAPSWFSRAQAATSSSANYLIITDTTDTGGATFSPNYANRASVEPVTGYSAATIPDSTTRFIYHGFVPQLDPPLFAVADVAVTLTASPILSSPTEAVAFSGTVLNQGAEAAPGVLLAVTLPANVTFNGVSVSQGNAALVGNVLRCALGTIPAGGTATFSIQSTATANGQARAAASLTVEAVDPLFANNSASALSTVVTAVRFTLPGGGSWYNPAHWSPPVVPGTNHKAFIDGDIVDFYDADATVAGLVLTDGRIGGAHRLTVTTLAEWSGGELQGGLALVIPPGGMLRVTNGYAVNLRGGSGIENHGTVRLESTALQSVFGAWVTNDGLFEVVGNRSFLRFENSAFDFHNRQGAIVRRSAGLGTNSIPVAFRNDGLVEVLTGVVDFNGSFINGGYSLVNTGTNRAAAGAEIRYTRANSLDHRSTFEGPGAHRIIADSMSPGDGTRFSGAIRGDFEILNGIISGAFTNTGRIRWTGGNFQSYGAGNLTIPPDSALIIGGGGDRALGNGYTIRNLGTVRLEGAGLWNSGGGIVDNQGLFDIAGDFSLRNGLAFTNRPGAILRKSAGLGTNSISGAFRNDGLVEVLTGVVDFNGSFINGGYSLVNTGTNRAAAGAEIRYTRANSLDHGSTFEGPGAHRIIADSMSPSDGTRFSGAIRGDFEILNGIISGVFTNTGRITWTGGNFQSYGPGILTIPPDSALIVGGGSDRTLLNGYKIRNLGTVRLEGAGLWNSGGGIVDNQGLFDIAGDFSLRNGLTFTNRPGAILRKSAGLGTSTATLNPFWNDGEMDLQTGTLALTGDFSPGASASLNLYLGGSAPGTQFSRLTASGVATLNGTLRVILKNGFSPSASDTFQIVTAGARLGIFAAFTVEPADGRFSLVPAYLAGGVALQLRPGPAVITTSSAQFRNGQFQFSFQGVPGATYVVEASPVLGPGATWLPIQTNVATAALTLVLDPNAKDQPRRFYRLRLVP